MTMQISESGKGFIRRHEGLRLRAYKDGGGVWTIGYGHTGNDVHPDSEWSVGQCDVAFEKDVQWAVHGVNSSVLVDLTQNQFDALVSFVYNLGGGAFNNSTLLGMLNAGDYEGAADQFPRWCHDNHKVVAGLLARRADEKRLFMTEVA